MQYKKFNSDYVVRLDPGDEIAASLSELAEKERICLASVNGLGAAREVTIGIFDPESKTYGSRTYTGAYEISALTGSISRMEDSPYLHLHITIGNPLTGECHAGHLSKAVISATGEIFLHVADGEVGRRFSETVGLNLFKF